MLKENFKKYFENLKKSDNNLESHLLAMLHEIQKENGHICEEDIEELSGLTQLPYSRIKAVLTFYTMYNLKKTGKYHLQICRNLSCHMAGAPKLRKILEEKLKIKEGEVTADGFFSFCEAECLGSCGTAPVISVNETYHENMDEKKLEKLLEDLRKNKI
ncbi:MAG: NAD(P)H-dependent oxidoreductase subunit E [Elusimicrobiota bacterium]